MIMNEVHIITNLLLFKVRVYFQQQSSKTQLPMPFLYGVQETKTIALNDFIEQRLSYDKLRKLINIIIVEQSLTDYFFNADEKRIRLFKKHAIELSKTYFAESQYSNCYLTQKKYYTTRLLWWSHYLNIYSQMSYEIKGKLAVTWEFIWDVQADEDDKKYEALSELLRLPPNSLLERA